MNIEILHLIEGAKNAEGIAVVIDVFRAFSLACYIVNQGCEKYYAVSDINEAYRLKKENPHYILIGERNEKIPEGFDYGNSPTHIQGIDFTGKTIIHTTSAGTQGLLNASKAKEIITGSFVNARSIANYLINKNENIAFVCMGYAAKYPTEEDTFCAEYIKSLILHKPYDLNNKIEIIKNTSALRLFDPKNQEFSPSDDFYLCTKTNIFNFVLKANKINNQVMELKKIIV